MNGATAAVHFLDNTDMPSLLQAPPMASSSSTKVICTLGPSCRSVETLVEMLEKGMTAARVDLTWGPKEYHVQSLRNLSEAMQRTKRLCATIVDTIGREVLVRSDKFGLDTDGWPVHSESFSIKAGQEVRITADKDSHLSSSCLPVTFPLFAQITQPGDTFFVGRYLASGADDSSVYLEAIRIVGADVICRAANDTELNGLLTVLHSAGSVDRGSGLNNMELPLLAEHDVAALRFIAERVPQLDFLALTFCRFGEDVEEARSLLDQLGLDHVKILAKVEDAEALHNFDEISSKADGIILSRGNLGLYVPPEKMARVQKSVISACNILGKPVILTRIVDTMIVSPRPTRAEATDVANAVLDGVDALMLGAETLRGRFPLATLATITSICRQAELVYDHDATFDNLVQLATKASEEDAEQPGGDSADSLDIPHLGVSTSDSSLGLQHGLSSTASTRSIGRRRMGRTARLESVASTAVRAAAKVGAKLIIVFAHTGRTAALVAKYRPSMPVLALVVPRLVQEGMHWKLLGLAAARQTLIVSGVIPILGAPMMGSSDALLQQAVQAATARDLVGADDHVVCLMSIKEDLVVEVVSVDSLGVGVKEHPKKEGVTSLPAAEPNFASTSGGFNGIGSSGGGNNGGRNLERRKSFQGAAPPHSGPLHEFVQPTASQQEGDGQASGKLTSHAVGI